jgi:hypothetical protein
VTAGLLARLINSTPSAWMGSQDPLGCVVGELIAAARSAAEAFYRIVDAALTGGQHSDVIDLCRGRHRLGLCRVADYAEFVGSGWVLFLARGTAHDRLLGIIVLVE